MKLKHGLYQTSMSIEKIKHLIKMQPVKLKKEKEKVVNVPNHLGHTQNGRSPSKSRFKFSKKLFFAQTHFQSLSIK